MIFILDNLKITEKVIFINSLTEINNFPTVYINYIDSLLPLIRSIDPGNFGAKMIGDKILSKSSSFNEQTLCESVIAKYTPIVKNLQKEFIRELRNKLSKVQSCDDIIVIDGIFDNEILQEIREVIPNVKIVQSESGNLLKVDEKIIQNEEIFKFEYSEKESIEEIQEKIKKQLNSSDNEIIIELEEIE